MKPFLSPRSVNKAPKIESHIWAKLEVPSLEQQTDYQKKYDLLFQKWVNNTSRRESKMGRFIVTPLWQISSNVLSVAILTDHAHYVQTYFSASDLPNEVYRRSLYDSLRLAWFLGAEQVATVCEKIIADHYPDEPKIDENERYTAVASSENIEWFKRLMHQAEQTIVPDCAYTHADLKTTKILQEITQALSGTEPLKIKTPHQ